jgi:hypothetical protein
MNTIKPRLSGNPSAANLIPPQYSRWNLRETVGILFLVAALAFLLALFSSGGHWTDWPTSSTYYDQLGDAFLHGQLNLLTEPDPRLAAIPNPYGNVPEGIHFLWDASYYQGHYYLYWGPVPALGVMLFRAIFHQPAGDNAIVLIAAMGILVFAVLILLWLRNEYFREQPVWLLNLAIIPVVLGSPLLWILNRPMVYEAAVASGQMLLLAGLYFILPALRTADHRAARYALAALCWALAAGARLTLAGAVGVLAMAAAIVLLRGALSHRALAAKLAALWVPLIAGVLLLGGYNYYRFRTPLESGFRYQLTLIDYTQPAIHIYTMRSIPINLFNYIGRNVSLQPAFPFIKPIEGKATFNPLPIRPPLPYSSEPVTGLLFSAPYLLCGLGLLLAGISRIRSTAPDQPMQIVAAFQKMLSSPIDFLGVTLAAAGLFVFVPLLLYFYCSERFVLDFVPLFLLLAAVGAWKAYEFTQPRPSWRAIMRGLIVGSALWTATASILLAVTGYGSHW